MAYHSILLFNYLPAVVLSSITLLPLERPAPPATGNIEEFYPIAPLSNISFQSYAAGGFAPGRFLIASRASDEDDLYDRALQACGQKHLAEAAQYLDRIIAHDPRSTHASIRQRA